MTSNIAIQIILTFSKITAFLLLAVSAFIDISQHTGGENLRSNAIWIATMVGVKQVADYYKAKIDGK